jgi:glycosidase
VDGFRVDVAHKMAHDPELRDNPLVELDEETSARPQRPGTGGWPS